MFIQKLIWCAVFFSTTSHLACSKTDTKFGTKIINGTKVEGSSTIGKSTVAITAPQGRSLCTGVFIAPQTIATAAHCIRPAMEFYGSIYIKFDLVAKSGGLTPANSRRVHSFILHEDFRPDFIEHTKDAVPPADLALLIFEGTAPETHEPAQTVNSSQQPQLNEAYIIAGYGERSRSKRGRKRNGELYKTQLKVTKISVDRKEFGSFYKSRQAHAACLGDSGGPAFVSRNGQLKVLGILSWGSKNCSGKSEVFTALNRYESWIRENSGT